MGDVQLIFDALVKPERIAYVVFDFDETLSVEHVFMTISDHLQTNYWPNPQTRKNVDQLAEMLEYKSAKECVVEELFGGQERVDLLTRFLQSLTEKHQVKVVISSKGIKEVIEYCCELLGIDKYFAGIYDIEWIPHGKVFAMLQAMKRGDWTDANGKSLCGNNVLFVDDNLGEKVDTDGHLCFCSNFENGLTAADMQIIEEIIQTSR